MELVKLRFILLRSLFELRLQPNNPVTKIIRHSSNFLIHPSTQITPITLRFLQAYVHIHFSSLNTLSQVLPFQFQTYKITTTISKTIIP